MIRVVAAIALVAACGDTVRAPDVAPALRLLESANADDRFEAVVQLGEAGALPRAQEALVGALEDTDAAVKLMAAIGLVAAEAGPFGAALAADRRTAPAPSAGRDVTPALTPNPAAAPAELLSRHEQLVYVDPWFAGALLPGMLAASRDRDRRVRGLAVRALAMIGERDQIDFRSAMRSGSPADAK